MVFGGARDPSKTEVVVELAVAVVVAVVVEVEVAVTGGVLLSPQNVHYHIDYFIR